MDTKVLLVLFSAIFILIVISFLVWFIIRYQKRNILFQVEKEILKSEFSQTLLQTQLEIQEQTLKNISQEIHDNIGQALSLAKLNLNTMLVTNDEALQQKILN